MILSFLKRLVQYWPPFPHLLAVLSIVWACGYFKHGDVLIVLSCALVYLFMVDSEQFRRLRVSLKRRIQEELLSARSRRGMNDSEPVQWLNALLRSSWPALEAGYVCKVVEGWIVQSLERLKPRKVVVERMRLGSSPPLIRACKVRQDHDGPSSAALELDISYVAADDMGIELAVPMSSYFTAKLYCDNLRIEGRLRLGFKFVAYFPYVSRLTVSFASEPTVALSVRPLSSNNLAVTDLPIIASWVSNSIHTAIQTCGLVDPERWDFDILEWWDTDYGLGPPPNNTKGGCYAILEVLEGRDLMAKDKSGFSDPYVIITYKSYKFKTETRKQTLNPSWHECFRIEIPKWGSSEEKVLFRLRDRDLIVDDELGFCELNLSNYRNGKRCEVWNKLENADSGELLVAVTVIGGEPNSNTTPAARRSTTSRSSTVKSTGSNPQSIKQGSVNADVETRRRRRSSTIVLPRDHAELQKRRRSLPEAAATNNNSASIERRLSYIFDRNEASSGDRLMMRRETLNSKSISTINKLPMDEIEADQPTTASLMQQKRGSRSKLQPKSDNLLVVESIVPAGPIKHGSKPWRRINILRAFHKNKKPQQLRLS